MSNNLLFQQFNLNDLHLKNRIVMAPMTRQYSPGNIPNAKVVDYYRRRAQGGVGLIITEGTCVGHKAASGYKNVPFIYGDDALAGWRKVVEAVHEEGGLIFPQIWHVGAVRRPGIEPDPETPAYSPSGLFKPGKPNGEIMSEDDIQECINAFAQAAADAQSVGFDGVEIHGAHGYLIDQFFWEGTNQRDDAYGDRVGARSRFAAEIVEAVRNRVGSQFPISFRFSQWKQQDYTARLAETPEALATFLEPLVDAGVDLFHCSTRRFWEPEFEGSELNLAGWTKKLSGKPTITVGSVGLDGDFIQEGSAEFTESAPASLDLLTERLSRDEFDLVAVGRALISNPDWPIKIRENQIDALKPYTKDALMQLI